MTTIPWWRTEVGEAETARLSAAAAAGNVGDGPLTADMEAAFAAALNVPYVIAVPSGSAALLMSFIALGIGPGDEVIVPDATWIATAHAASLLGARIVLVDTCADRPVMDPEAVARAMTERTKVIVPVHLGGRAVELEPILDLAKRHGVRVLEDACQALFSSDPRGPLGTRGDIGCFSLGVAKLLTTGQGGLVATRDPDLYARLRRVKFHGVVADGTWETYAQLGFNFKYTDLMAAIGLEQLAQASRRVTHVRDIYRRYADGLANHPAVRISLMDMEGGETPLWTEIEVANGRLTELVGWLAAAGVQTRRVHPPLHRARHLSRASDGDFPNAAKLCESLLVLPSGPTQPLENVDLVIEMIRGWR